MATTTNNGWDIPDSTDYVKDGYLAIDTLGQDIDTSVGTGLLAWTSWAPTLSGWSAGNGTFDAKYAKLGKIVHVSFVFTVGSTTTKGASFTTTLPVTARIAFGGLAPVRLIRSATYYGVVSNNTTTSATVTAMNTATSTVSSAAVSSTVPGTWTTGDTITFTFTYEAA